MLFEIVLYNTYWYSVFSSNINFSFLCFCDIKWILCYEPSLFCLYHAEKHYASYAYLASESLFYVLFQMLEIWAVLDAEPEVNETFTVTLSNPTGGARLGDQLHTLITVLENLAPSGLFRIGPALNRSESSCPKKAFKLKIT